MRDSFEREIRYLRVSVTDRCNLRCVYCMPPEGVPWIPHGQVLSFEAIRDAVSAAIGLGFDKVRLTGGEPLVRRGILDLVSMLRAVPGLGTLAMTTNGTLLGPLAEELRTRGLDSLNISLDTLDPERYAELTRGGVLADALAGIEAARAAGFPVKLNVVVFESKSGVENAGDTASAEPSQAAEPSRVAEPALAAEAGPATVAAHAHGASVSELEAIQAYARKIGARVQTIARYRLDQPKDDGHGYERPPPCAGCDRIRLLANGVLRPCLRSALDIPLDPEHPRESIASCVRAKPLHGATCSDRNVAQIGG